MVLYFSYRTLIAFRGSGLDSLKEGPYSRTTSKHIGQMTLGQVQKVSPDLFESRLSLAFAVANIKAARDLVASDMRAEALRNAEPEQITRVMQFHELLDPSQLGS